MVKAIVVVGTTSHAGKSFLTTALCRLLKRQGWRVAPFKGQNMALNAYVTDTGGEMGYAQAVQSWAAGVNPRVEMNPILLKPQGNMTSQVVMRGKVVGTTTAAEYYERYFHPGWRAITDSLEELGKDFDIIVCEGAGSPAEINLKHRDLTNMRVAKYLNAPAILVVDIDRGGSFAHVVGTLALLDADERALVKGIVINKFRGQKSLLDPGIEWLENYTGIPVLGVLPYTNIDLSAEDSLSLLDVPGRKPGAELDISIVRLPRIANFTDFEPLAAESTVNVRYVGLNDSLGHPDAVILPGSKTTIGDLRDLHDSGTVRRLKDYVNGGGTILGICGGFQMLGESVSDPEGLESSNIECEGLNLVPLKTVITSHKITRQRQIKSAIPVSNLTVNGYEIHQGKSYFEMDKNDFESLFIDDADLGTVNGNRSIWGCYLHGLLDNGSWRRGWLNILRRRRGLSPLPIDIGNYGEQRERAIDNTADLVGEYLDLSPIMANL